MAIEINKEVSQGTVEQRMVYESGNEMAAYAAHQINYHVMGYFPISPSTEVAQFLDLMKLTASMTSNSFRQTESMGPQGFVTGPPPQADAYSMQPALTAIYTCWSRCRFNPERVFRW